VGCERLSPGAGGSRSDSRAVASPPWAPAAAGATAGPAALPSVPAATAMDMMPPPPPPCLGDTPHAPHARPCPPMPPHTVREQLEPAPRRQVGGMAVDICRPHLEDRPAQGRTGIVRYA
jgi:hypothetical protein